MTRKSGMLACLLVLAFLYLVQILSQLSGGIREENVTKMSGEAEPSPGRNIPTPEQCFYASFKIYLSDSRTNSICELEDSGWLKRLEFRKKNKSPSPPQTLRDKVRL